VDHHQEEGEVLQLWDHFQEGVGDQGEGEDHLRGVEAGPRLQAGEEGQGEEVDHHQEEGEDLQLQEGEVGPRSLEPACWVLGQTRPAQFRASQDQAEWRSERWFDTSALLSTS
jgi:hypothetical protein